MIRAHALAFVTAATTAVACGGGGAPATGPRGPSPASDGGADATTSAAPDTTMPLEALAQRGPTDAPLMREIARVPNVLPKTADIAAERDQCVRMLVSSSALVKLSLVDASGATRGEPTTVTTAPVAKVPAGGPACVKKGEALRLVVEGAPPGATVRAVVFASP